MAQPRMLLRRAPEDLDAFQCTACGGCCELWTVLIDDASFERTTRFLKKPPEPPPHPDQPWFVQEGDQRRYAMTPDGACVFRDENRLCYLHRHDPNLKSEICRIYPNELVRTPDGYDQSLAFSSRGALEHVLMNGRPFRLRESKMQAVLSGEPVKPHPVAKRPDISWKAFLEIERRLIAFLADGAELEKDLLAAGSFLADADRRGRDGALDAALAGGLHPKNFRSAGAVSNIDGAHRLIVSILRLRIGSLFFAASRATIETFLDRLETLPEAAGMSRGAFYRRLRRQRWLGDAAALDAVTRKYLLYKIFAKKFFMEFGLVRGWNMLCLLFCLVRLHALFASDGDGPLRPAALFPSFEFVERHFSHTAQFNRFWLELVSDRLLDTADLSETLILG